MSPPAQTVCALCRDMGCTRCPNCECYPFGAVIDEVLEELRQGEAEQRTGDKAGNDEVAVGPVRPGVEHGGVVPQGTPGAKGSG